jgi:hypothetical protein
LPPNMLEYLLAHHVVRRWRELRQG